MAETPGICTQTTTCEVARSGRTMTVPLGSPFVCPECARGLVPPVQSTEAVSAQRMPAAVPLALVGAGLLVLGGAVFLGRELGESRVALAPQMASGSPTVISVPAPPSAPPVQLAAAAPSPAPATMTAAPSPPIQAALPAPVAVATGAPASRPADARPAIPPAQSSAPAVIVANVASPVSKTVASTAPGPALPVAVNPVFASKMAALPPPAATQPAKAPPVSAPIAIAAAAPLPPPLPDQSFSPVPTQGGSPAYPAELVADGRSGRVNVNCLIATDGSPSGCHAVSGKGGPAFATATLAWLAHGHVRFKPIILHGRPLAASRSWTLSIEEPAPVLAEAKRKQQEAAKAEAEAAAKTEIAAAQPEPATRTAPAIDLPVRPIIARQVIAAPPHEATERAFSTRVVAGGAPVFPASYDESRPGAVTVQCTIEEDGAPELCRVLKAVGGSAFGKAAQSWLDSGRVRFRPVISGGRAVASEESWTIVFNNVPSSQ